MQCKSFLIYSSMTFVPNIISYIRVYYILIRSYFLCSFFIYIRAFMGNQYVAFWIVAMLKLYYSFFLFLYGWLYDSLTFYSLG